MRCTPIQLLDEDADLAAGLGAEDTERVRRALVVPAVRVDAGRFGAAELRAAAAVRGELFAVLLLDGAIAVHLRVASQPCTQFLGAGDVLPVEEAVLPLPTTLELHATQPTRLAVLDDRFLAVARRWPSVFRQVLRRSTHQQLDALLHRAVAQMPQVEGRLLGAFWCLADRWGTVGPRGVTVDVDITHAALGQLVGARRPTVSLGLKALDEAGVLQREGQDRWLLSPASLEMLGAGEAPRRVTPAAQARGGRRMTAGERAALRERLLRVREQAVEHRARTDAAIATSRSTWARIERRREAPGG